MPVCIIAEAGVNHNGDLNIAFELCKAAKEAGADVVKFQTWKTESIITRNVAQAEYQIENNGTTESQFDMLKKLELSYEDFTKIKKYCDTIGITFASTADEEESLDFLLSIGIPFVKVGSGDIGNVSYLRYIGSKGLPVILSTGMSNMRDVEVSVNALRQGGAKNITLLHCVTNYPCPYEDVNLKAMDTLATHFNLPVGFSDHTKGIEISVAAVARGARVIEKHFTLDKNMKGPDHLASTEPEEFKKMVLAIRNVEMALGNGDKKPTGSEVKISAVVKKRIVAKRKITSGSIITDNDICVKRNDRGLTAEFWDNVVGIRADRNYETDEPIVICGENTNET